MPRKSAAIRDIELALREIERAEARRNEFIRRAFQPEWRKQYGYTVDDIAEAAGLSRPRIYQIVNEANDGSV